MFQTEQLKYLIFSSQLSTRYEAFEFICPFTEISLQ